MARKVRRPHRAAQKQQRGDRPEAARHGGPIPETDEPGAEELRAAGFVPVSDRRDQEDVRALAHWQPVTETPLGKALQAELERLPEAERQAREEEATKMAGYLTVAEAAAVTGTTRFHISRLVKREGLTTYVQRTDRRRKYLRRADVERLMRPEPAPPTPESDAGAEGSAD